MADSADMSACSTMVSNDPASPHAAGRLAVGSLLAFLVAAVGFRVFGLYHWHDSQRVLELVVLAIVAACVIASPPLARQLIARAGGMLSLPDRWALLAASVCGTASAALAQSPRFAFAELTLFGLLATTIVVVAQARCADGSRFDRVALFTAAGAAAALVAPFLVAWLAGVSTDAGLIPGFLYQSGFSNVRFLGQFHTLVLPLLACAFLLPGLSRGYRAAIFIVLAFTWVMAISTATRATWFAWVIGLAMVLPFARLQLWPLVRVQAIALALGSVLTWLMFELAPRYAVNPIDPAVLDSFFGRFGDPLALSMRDELWTRAVELIGLNPWLGVGPMMLALDHNRVATHPHNALLQLAAEWGIPAALALVAVSVRLWWRLACALRAACRRPAIEAGLGVDHRAQAQTTLACALFWSVSGAAVHSMVDGLLVMPYAQIACAWVIGWTLGLLLPDTQGGDTRPAERRRVPAFIEQRAIPAAFALALAVASVLLANGAVPEALRIDERELAYFERHPFDLPRKPRLWAQGWLADDLDAQAPGGAAR